jgi:hypothetical protein
VKDARDDFQPYENGAASTLTLAVVLSATLVAQIPKQAQWEITFAQVEAADDLPDLSTGGSETYEARVMQRPWSAVAPMPFLRVVRTAGAMRGVGKRVGTRGRRSGRGSAS